MSLLNKASIITTPTAYAEDYLYSIKPAYALGSELVTNGDFSDGTNNWTPNANATLSVENGRLKVAISGAGSGYPLQNITTEVGKKYKITANAFIGTATKVSLYSAVFGFNDLSADGSYDLTFVATSTSTQIRLYVYGDGNYGFWDNVSVKEITDADFDFDRNSTGTRVNEDYLIEDVPYNFVTYSEDFTQWTIQSGTTVTSNTTETLSPSGEYNASKIVGNGTSGIFNSGLSSIGGTNTKSIYIKGTEAGQVVYLKDPNQTVNNKVLTLTTEWQRYTLTESQTSDFGIWIDDIPTSGIYMWGAQVVKGDQPKDYLKTTDRLDIPRIDYTNGEPSILLEPSRTNNVTNSNNSFTANNTTITYNNINSPEGIQNAFKVECTSSGTAVFARTASIAFTDPVTFSVFVKYGNAQYLQFLDSVSGNHFLNFDVEKGEIGTSGSDTVGTFVEYPNGWYRVSATFSGLASSSTFRLYISNSNSAGYGSGTATVGDFYYAYGWQVENGSYATSLIHTSGSAVTRSADVANNAGNSDLINSTEGVLYAEIKALADDGTNRTIALNKDTNDRIQLYFNTSTNGLSIFYKAQGTTSFIMNETLSDATEFNKVAFKWKANDFALWVNGTETDTVSSGVTSNADTLNALEFEMFNDNSTFYGNAKMVAVFKEALSDTELECLTGYNSRELYLNYYNRLSFIGVTEEYNVESDINNYIL